MTVSRQKKVDAWKSEAASSFICRALNALHKRPRVNLEPFLSDAILPFCSHHIFFQDDKSTLEMEGRKEGEYFTANLPSDSLTSMCCVQPTHSPPVRHFPISLANSPFSKASSSSPPSRFLIIRYRINSTISCQSAQCQRRKLPPHPNPPRNPPARQDSSNQKFDFFDDQKKSKVRVSRVKKRQVMGLAPTTKGAALESQFTIRARPSKPKRSQGFPTTIFIQNQY